jgi:hypothetical protein
MENQKLKDQNKSLENLRILLNDQVESLTKKANDQDKIIQRMQRTIDENDNILENLGTRCGEGCCLG